MKRVNWEGTRKLTTIYQPHESRMYVQQDSHDFEKLLASQNSRLRAMGQTGVGPVRLHLQMSEQDYEQLIRKYPLLRHGNRDQRRTLWEKVARERPELVAMEFKKRLFAAGVKDAG